MSEIDPYTELKRQMSEAKERFASDVEGATMTVVKDDGVHRHLSFRFPKASWEWCEVVTWPGMLVLRGGLGCWSFTRVEDMFGFFRPTPHRERIDPVYWAGKLVPGSGSEAKEYNAKRAASYIRNTVVDAIVEYPSLSEDVENDLFPAWGGPDLSTEAGLRAALGRFEGAYQDIHKGFRFPVEDWDLHRYSDWFLLSCLVLPWAVEQYDAVLAPVG
ncbi:hypothetical protein AB0K09_20310 [Streptomyces sp. NPDC049577]|uniref:hypothetical protein n=1 Tax=Streptomyces sp. NPDC049577 TaxID=3155153 RepID=UPI003426C425